MDFNAFEVTIFQGGQTGCPDIEPTFFDLCVFQNQKNLGILRCFFFKWCLVPIDGLNAVRSVWQLRCNTELCDTEAQSGVTHLPSQNPRPPYGSAPAQPAHRPATAPHVARWPAPQVVARAGAAPLPLPRVRWEV